MTIKIYGSQTAGDTPPSLADRQLAINQTDEILFFKNTSGTIRQVPVGKLAQGLYALLASPAFTGAPTAPTQASGDNSTKLATTAYVAAALSAASGAVTSVAGRTGAVTLAVADVSGAAPLASPTFTGAPAGPTPSAGTNTTQFATTAFVTTATASFVTSAQAAAAAPVQSVAGRSGAVTLSASDISGLGGAATLSVGTTSGTVASGNDSRITGALQSSANAAAVDLWAGTSTAKFNTPKSLYDASAPVAIADAATVTPDLSTFLTASLTIAGNRTLANPVNAKAGQSGYILVVQDSTGSRTLSFGTAFDFGAAGAPTLSTAGGAIDAITYFVMGTSPLKLLCSCAKGF